MKVSKKKNPKGYGVQQRADKNDHRLNLEIGKGNGADFCYLGCKITTHGRISKNEIKCITV